MRTPSSIYYNWGRQIAGYGRIRITNVDNWLEIANDIHDINVFVLLIRVEEHLLHTKGRVDMTTPFDRLPTVTPASWIPGPGQGHWTYNDYAAPSQVLAGLPVQVEQFFA